MADGLTTAAGTLAIGGAGTLAVANFLPGIDLTAVIGAFGGAFFFIVFAKNISALQRVGYLIVGWIGGYMASAEMLSQKWTLTSGFSSFVAGLLCVVIGISIIEAVETGKWPAWLTGLPGLLARLLNRSKQE